MDNIWRAVYRLELDKDSWNANDLAEEAGVTLEEAIEFLKSTDI